MSILQRVNWERSWPTVFSVIALVASWRWGCSIESKLKDLSWLLGAVLTISSILVGFLAVVMSVLLTAPHDRTHLPDIMRAGYGTIFYGYLGTAIRANLLCAVFTIITYATWHLNDQFSGKRIIFSAWLWLAAFAAASAYRFMSLFLKSVKTERV